MFGTTRQSMCDLACERIENAYRQAPLVPHVQAKQVQEALL